MKAVPGKAFQTAVAGVKNLFLHGKCTGGGRPETEILLTRLISFIAGLIIALCLCRMFETCVLSAALDSRLAAAYKLSTRPPSFINTISGHNLEKFASLNPFGAAVNASAKKDGKPKNAYPIESLILAGTLPGAAAWIRDGSEASLVLKGQEYHGYTLSEVEYGKIVLSLGKADYDLYLKLSGGTDPEQHPAAKVDKMKPANKDFAGIIAPQNGAPGVLPRELVDKLLMNPYSEIAKMRLVPTDKGMKLQRMDPDSILGIVGVRKGDVLSAVNGINITNLGDAANAVNSLMSGSRFDVTVLRNGSPMSLPYEVK